jgi:hypothetical protein
MSTVSTTKVYKRSTNGSALSPPDPVVAADLVALAAGVNFTSVVKVMLAINAVADHYGVTPELVMSPSFIPAQGANDERFDATEQAALGLEDNPLIWQYEKELHFISRRRHNRERAWARTPHNGERDVG